MKDTLKKVPCYHVDSWWKQRSERGMSASVMAEIINGERSKAINAKIQQRYLIKAGREDPRMAPVFTAASEVTRGLTPHVWRGRDHRDAAHASHALCLHRF